jgi:hypothetical protein
MPWSGTMACSTSLQQRTSWPITGRKAIGSTLVASSRLTAISSRSSSAAVTKIPLNTWQVDLAQERLGMLGLRIKRLPGGHLTTNEQPKALAALITEFEQGLSKTPELQSKTRAASAR